MTRKSIATLGILIVLLVSIVGSAAGQTGDDPEVIPVPTANEEQAGSKYFTHPVVQILSKYFDRDKGLVTDPTDPEATPDPLATPDPEATDEPGESESGLGPIGEQIAAYHAEGMGFGVLVKLYAMAEASEEACAAQVDKPIVDEETGETHECVPVTAEELVESFKGGTGMGQLFKEHGKPALLGVGHVKKAVKAMDAEATLEPDETETVIETEEESLQGKKPVHPVKPVKTNNGKGHKK